MAKRTFTVTDPNGTIHTRTSQSRTYSHAVLFRHSYERDMQVFDQDWSVDGKNWEYARKVAEGRDPYASVNYLAQYPDRHSPEAIAENQARVDAENARRVEKAKAEIEGVGSREEAIAKGRAARVAMITERLANGYYEAYQCAGWCGRIDLAQKLAAKQVKDPLILEAV